MGYNIAVESTASKKLDNFFKDHKKKKYKTKEILIHAESEPEGLFYLTEGVVRQYAISTNGEELTINLFKAKSFFPVGWIINDSLSAHYFEALTPVEVAVAPKKAALELLKKDQEVIFDLLKRIYRGLEGYFSRMEYLLGGKARERLVMELLIHFKRFGKVKLTESELAAQAGMARETVSREIRKLKLEGLVKTQRGSLTITDVRKLEDQLL